MKKQKSMIRESICSPARSAPNARNHWLCLIAILGACISTSYALGASDPAPIQALSHLDLDRYLGHWYEIAKYPNRFQKQCVSETTADYRRLDDGQIEVINRCRRGDGLFDEARGEARKAKADGFARLEVRFAPKWLSFLPFVWGDYWVIDLDPNYQWSVVSEPGRRYLWILSRSPKLDAPTLSGIIRRLQEKNFDTDRLEMTVQTPE